MEKSDPLQHPDLRRSGFAGLPRCSSTPTSAEAEIESRRADDALFCATPSSAPDRAHHDTHRAVKAQSSTTVYVIADECYGRSVRGLKAAISIRFPRSRGRRDDAERRV